MASSHASYGSVAASTVAVTTTDNVKVVLDPIAAFPGNQPTLTWQPVVGASRYEIWFSRLAPSGTRIYSATDLTATTWTPPAGLDAGNYRYWVRAFDVAQNPMTWSTPKNISVRPTVTSPTTPTFDKRPVFAWPPVPFAESYELYLRTSAGDTVHPVPSGTQWTPTSDLPAGEVKWWIRAVAGTASLPWSLAGVTNVYGVTKLLTPAGPTPNTTPVLTWQTVIGASKYILHVVDSNNEVVIREEQLTQATFTPTVALASGSYRAWVKAIDGSGLFSSGIWSNQFNISIISITSTLPADETDNELTVLNQPFRRVENPDVAQEALSKRHVREMEDVQMTEAAATSIPVRLSQAGTPVVALPAEGGQSEIEFKVIDYVMAQLSFAVT